MRANLLIWKRTAKIGGGKSGWARNDARSVLCWRIYRAVLKRNIYKNILTKQEKRARKILPPRKNPKNIHRLQAKRLRLNNLDWNNLRGLQNYIKYLASELIGNKSFPQLSFVIELCESIVEIKSHNVVKYLLVHLLVFFILYYSYCSPKRMREHLAWLVSFRITF